MRQLGRLKKNGRALLAWLGHAFQVEPERDSAMERNAEELLRRLAKEVVARHMSAPALLLLESLRPVSPVGAQVMHVIAPLYKAVFESESFDNLSELLNDRRNLERLIREIECLEREDSERAMQYGD